LPRVTVRILRENGVVSASSAGLIADSFWR
jgi:hypothetical protein